MKMMALVLVLFNLFSCNPAPTPVPPPVPLSPSYTITLTWHQGPDGVNTFNIYRDGVKVNSVPIVGTTYTDVVRFHRGTTHTYYVLSVVNGVESPVTSSDTWSFTA